MLGAFPGSVRPDSARSLDWVFRGHSNNSGRVKDRPDKKGVPPVRHLVSIQRPEGPREQGNSRVDGVIGGDDEREGKLFSRAGAGSGRQQ